MALAEVRSFEEEWPGVATGLDRVLARRRVPKALRDDIVQETGLRVLKNWDHFDMQRPLWPLALTIAMNLVRDDVRERTRHVRVALVPTEASDCDIEREALARLELKRVEEAMELLSPAQRSVLLAEVGAGTGEHLTSSAVNMLRMRARRRLKGLLEQVSGFAALLGAKFRNYNKALETLGVGDGWVDETNRVAAAMVAVAGAFSLVATGIPADLLTPAPGVNRQVVASSAAPGSSASAIALAALPGSESLDQTTRFGRSAGTRGTSLRTASARSNGSGGVNSDGPTSSDDGASDPICLLGCDDGELDPMKVVGDTVQAVEEAAARTPKRAPKPASPEAPEACVPDPNGAEDCAKTPKAKV